MLKKPLRFSHEILKESIVSGDVVIDATVGNGNDTVLLAQLVGISGKVYGFDIQSEAIEATREKLLLTSFLPRVELIHAGHEKMTDYVPENLQQQISAIVFNLGYLPKGDKNVVTTPQTTIAALKSSMFLLRKGGLISIMVYSGHEGGLDEKDAVAEFVTALPQEEWSVLSYRFVNQVNNPPYLYVVEKK